MKISIADHETENLPASLIFSFQEKETRVYITCPRCLHKIPINTHIDINGGGISLHISIKCRYCESHYKLDGDEIIDSKD